MDQNKKGLLVVLSGPSGVGKGTVCAGLDLDDLNMKISTSMTTRDPREGEIDGISYYFVDRETFMNAVENGEMLEYDCHFKSCYGTPKKPVEKLREAGINVLLEIETNGARQVMDSCPDTLSIFLAPPSEEELRRRIIGRGSESDAQIQERLAKAEEELKLQNTYDYVVVNDDLNQTIEKISSIIRNASSHEE